MFQEYTDVLMLIGIITIFSMIMSPILSRILFMKVKVHMN
jgi:hypothetical protein